MAECLVLNRNSWMDNLSEKELNEFIARQPKFIHKYNARQVRGDLVEIQEDGFWTTSGRGYDKANFDLVIIKGKTKKEIEHMTRPLYKDNFVEIEDELTKEKKTVNMPILLKKFKYNIETFIDKGEVELDSITEKAI